MKPLRPGSAAIALLFVLGIACGCAQKKPVLVMPQQPPTATPEPSPTPEAAAEAQPAEQPQEAQQPAATTADQAKTADKTKPRHGRHVATKKPPQAPNNGDKPEIARNNGPKTVVVPAEKPNPSPSPLGGQIAPGPTPADTTRNQTSTDQLLQGAEANLNGITRQLSKEEEAMRAQIRDFITQSRKATTENDPARAHTLAVKARLLSDDLVKQR
jgi:hypothetical protein